MPRAAYWHKVPLDLATCAAADRLCRMLRTPLADAHLVRLWGWCYRFNRARRFQGDTAAATLAAQAGWRGTPQRFLGALVASGFATVEGAEVVLNDLVSVSQKDTKGLPDMALSGTESVPKTPPKTPRREPKGTGAGAVVEAKPAQKAPETPVSARAHTGESRVQSPEQVQEQEQEQVHPAAVASGGGLFKDLPATNPPSVESVWRHFAAGSPKSILTPDRKKLIASWLTLYPEADLHRTIDGYRASAFHNGDNDSGKKHLSLELMFRDAKHIEDGWNLAPGSGPPPPVPPAFARVRFDEDSP